MRGAAGHRHALARVAGCLTAGSASVWELAAAGYDNEAEHPQSRAAFLAPQAVKARVARALSPPQGILFVSSVPSFKCSPCGLMSTAVTD